MPRKNDATPENAGDLYAARAHAVPEKPPLSKRAVDSAFDPLERKVIAGNKAYHGKIIAQLAKGK